MPLTQVPRGRPLQSAWYAPLLTGKTIWVTGGMESYRKVTDECPLTKPFSSLSEVSMDCTCSVYQVLNVVSTLVSWGSAKLQSEPAAERRIGGGGHPVGALLGEEVVRRGLVAQVAVPTVPRRLQGDARGVHREIVQGRARDRGQGIDRVRIVVERSEGSCRLGGDRQRRHHVPRELQLLRQRVVGRVFDDDDRRIGVQGAIPEIGAGADSARARTPGIGPGAQPQRLGRRRRNPRASRRRWRACRSCPRKSSSPRRTGPTC